MIALFEKSQNDVILGGVKVENIQEYVNTLNVEKRAYINGKYCEAVGKEILKKKSSIDGRDLSGVSACDYRDIDVAVQCANFAYEQGVWRLQAPDERKSVMLRLAVLMEAARLELAALDTLETGRSFKNYYNDSIPKAIEALRYFAEGIDKYYDTAVPARKNSFAIISREALGVVGIITPWNDPLVVSMWKIAPALLMGNSVVVKPAEQSSFSILKVAQLAVEAGLPKGVLNVVPGKGEIAGKALALHMDVRGIFFTGSSEIGKEIIKYSGMSNMKKVGLECGGKSPYIVTRKCSNIKKAAEILAKNVFYNQGQICSAPTRAIVDKKIKEEFIAYLKEECEKYVPADPFSIYSEVGCVVSEEQKKKIDNYIRLGIENGAIVYTATTKNEIGRNSMCVQPTIFWDVTNQDIIAREEIFGPIAVVLESESTEEAVQIANDTKYGLAAAIWTNDLDEAHRVSQELRAGIVHINSYGDDDNMAPFGGMKESGIGKDKSLYAFDEYSVLKTTWVHINSVR